MRNLIIGIVVVLIVGLGVFLLAKNNSSNKTTSNTSSTSTNSNSADNTAASDLVTITYSDSGFSPSTANLKAGGKLTITNSSSSTVQVNSDPHPFHTDNEELNIGAINAGESKTVTLNKTGTWGYHNHIDSSQKAHITVQ